MKTYPWLTCPDKQYEKVFCYFCTEAINLRLPLPPMHKTHLNAKEAFVVNGFNTWSRAHKAFKNHEKSEFHRNSCFAIASMKQAPVIQQVSNAKEQSMIEARKVLAKIFETIQFIAREGIAFRGDYVKEEHAEHSKFTRLIELRANDIPELKSWLHRTSHKWFHHSIVEEILNLMADFILRKIISEVQTQKYFAIMIDETSDLSRLEQVCISFRYVTDELVIKEDFVGFYETGNTQADTLFNIAKDVVLRFGLDMENIRGQCYDGASNVSGHISGLQTRILEVSPTALFVHCVAHRLNLVVQDALTSITEIRNFIGTAQDLITFVKGSPRRLAVFSDIAKTQDEQLRLQPKQKEKTEQKEKKIKKTNTLLSYCPTRWCVRIKSLKRVKDNYANLIEFFQDMAEDATFESSITAKADGYLKKMDSFAFYFNLLTLIFIFEIIENLNEALQKHDLDISNSHNSINITIQSIEKLRNDDAFRKHWSTVMSGIEKLDIEPPSVPRVRKAPKRYESQSSPHNFSTPEELYRKLYFEVIDTTLTSLRSRFKSETLDFLTKIENFILNKGDHVDEIVSFYNKDNFDKERLTLHRDMLLDVFKNRLKFPPKNLTEIITFLRTNLNLKDIIPELFKLIKIFLTVPVSNCTCERSFSALRRLKTHLRTSLCAQRLNHASVLHVHNDIEINIEQLMNEFISKNNLRMSTFKRT